MTFDPNSISFVMRRYHTGDEYARIRTLLIAAHWSIFAMQWPAVTHAAIVGRG
jgi:hypothetical protein